MLPANIDSVEDTHIATLRANEVHLFYLTYLTPYPQDLIRSPQTRGIDSNDIHSKSKIKMTAFIDTFSAAI